MARGLLERGAHVVMACRNMQACELARGELLQANPQASAGAGAARGGPQRWGSRWVARLFLLPPLTPPPHRRSSRRSCCAQGSAECARLDLESRESIEGFAAATKQRLSRQRRRLDVLVNNAGPAPVYAINGEGEGRGGAQQGRGVGMLCPPDAVDALSTLAPASRLPPGAAARQASWA